MGELQGIFDCYTDALEQIGLEIHPGKCQSFEALVRSNVRVSSGVGGHKMVHTNALPGLKHKEVNIPALSGEKVQIPWRKGKSRQKSGAQTTIRRL